MSWPDWWGDPRRRPGARRSIRMPAPGLPARPSASMGLAHALLMTRIGRRDRHRKPGETSTGAARTGCRARRARVTRSPEVRPGPGSATGPFPLRARSAYRGGTVRLKPGEVILLGTSKAVSVPGRRGLPPLETLSWARRPLRRHHASEPGTVSYLVLRISTGRGPQRQPTTTGRARAGPRDRAPRRLVS
jgi:hypothetical protein